MNVTIVGLGKIGMPLAVQFASKGATRHRLRHQRRARRRDQQQTQSAAVANPASTRRSPALVVDGHLRATTDPRDAVANADVVVLIVPVDIDDAHRPTSRCSMPRSTPSARTCKRGVLVIVETTVPVGTTRHRVGPKIAAATGLAPSADFSLAFSPERVSSGRVLRDLRTYPKIVGGIDAHSTARAVDFYTRHARRRHHAGARRRDSRVLEARRDDVPRRQHRARQRVRAHRRQRSASTRSRRSTPRTRSRTRTSMRPAPASAATASPSTRTSSPPRTDAATSTPRSLITTARESTTAWRNTPSPGSRRHRFARRDNRRHPRTRLPRRSERVAPLQRLRPRRAR